MLTISLTIALIAGLPDDKPKDGDKPEGQVLKVIARGNWKPAGVKEQQQLVIRSVEELAKVFKVESIDWKQQMIVVASGGTKRTGGYSVEIAELRLKDNVLTVRWKLHAPKPGSPVTQTITHPVQAALVERFEGKTVFDPPLPKEEKKGEK